MLQRLVLCAAVLCALLTVRGSAQPARCGATFQITGDRGSFIIVPEVDNCFICPSSFDQWSLQDGIVTRPIGTTPTSIADGATTAVVEGRYLVISMPQLFVLVGNIGRRDIFCADGLGITYETQLTSPELMAPQFDDITATEGGTLTLNCLNTAAVSISRLQIIAPNGTVVGINKFIVQNVTRTSAGTYTCIVSSTIANNTNQITVMAEVIIEYAPEITPVNSTNVRYEVSLGSELRLSCSYIGVPSPDVIWLQNNTESLMDGLGGVTILRGDTMFTIVISSVDRDSGGTYTCNATNSVGSDKATYRVLILIPPAPVTNLMVTNIGERAVTLSWMTGFNGFTPITGIVVDVIPERGSGMANLPLVNDGMQNITGLMPFRNHIFSVAVMNMVGLSDQRNISASTLSLRLEAPTNVMFVAETSTNIRLTWDPPVFDMDTTDVPQLYTVEFMRTDGTEYNITNVTAVQRVIDYQNLAKGVDYQASITPHNVRGPGAISPLVMNQTLVDPPDMPQNLIVQGVGAEVLRVSWEPPENDGGRPVNMYRVVVTTIIPPYVANVPVAMDTSLLIRNAGLMESTTYTVVVSASNLEQGFGMNATGMATTQSFEEPQTIFDEPISNEMESTNSTAVLSWEFPGGTVNTYLVQYVLSRSDFETGMVVNVTVNGSETSVAVDNLLPGSTYQFRVAVLNDRGISAFSTAGTFETLPPDPPIITSSQSNPVPTGTTVTLNCTSTLVGAVYSWTTDTTDITNDNRFEIGPNYLRIVRVDASVIDTYRCTASTDNNNIRVSSTFRLEVLPIEPPSDPAIDQTVIIIVAVVGGVALLIFIVVVFIAICCLCGMKKRSSSGNYPMKKMSKQKEPQNANWIETSTQYVPATGNQPPAEAGNPSDRLAFDYSVDLQTHSSFNTLEKNAVHSTANPALPTQPIGVHAPVAPGSQYEIESPMFEYVPSEMPVVNGNEASVELPTYANTTVV